ncbi:DNA primase [Arcobacter nitrofigilis DSM 7299]|uniref:DNA primase n=1 Tax=Arcobacter nitrofigilis (strain ATCC 33309 / DSM 7299 / CCUG 15893 / LMG 7604 / NCTC 12251 / CI) TaxID=572480 RepID=D5V148_ARCNC|nr:DNA primase [Arcobacter nitrofigilis]ADG94010.1 DNA primase [Arcobacter nitrofigilis DSM 7299]
MINKDSIENLKNNVDIVDTISQFLQLKKSGANFKACCPFHGESTPSFVVSPAKQIYHCFGCGVGGDSIKFVMEYEKLSYPEAIEKLASMNNFTLVYDDTEQKKQDTKAIEEINKYYKKNFVVNDTAKEYIKSRGIYESSIEKFEIGYAPSSGETINYLKSKFLNLNDAKELGIIDTGANGLYARFIERITFPIYSLNGGLVGFGGRTITGHNAKYVNSPQTKIFNKSRLLYGYNLSKEKIYKKKEIIITEGYLDVIMLHQAGFDNAVATLGTALTKDHLPILKRGEPRVIVAYDGDNAGLNAAFKASLLMAHNDFEGGVIIFEKGFDPADMVKDGKIEELNKIFSKPKPFIPFTIDHIISQFDLNDPQNKQKALHEVNEFLNTLNAIYHDEYSRYIAQKLNIRENLIKITKSTTNRNNNVQLSKVDIGELCIIKAILNDKNRLSSVLDIIDASMFDYHKNEFEILLTNIDDERLNSVLLNERLEDYDDERLNAELLILLGKFYSNKLNEVLYDKNYTFNEKSSLIRKIRDNISMLKKGKLITYNL